MIIKGRAKTAMIMCLSWAITVAVSLYLISEMYGQDPIWFFVLFSLFVMICGLIAYLGNLWIVCFPLFLLLEESLERRDVKKISSILGILFVVMSYPFVLLPYSGDMLFTMTFVLVSVFVLVTLIVTVYAFISEKFKVDPESAHDL